MTKQEFGAWLDGHYDELRQRLNGGRDGWAREAMQIVVTRLLEDSSPLANVEMGDGLEPWLVARMNGEIRNVRRAGRLASQGAERFALTFNVLGDDTYRDTAAENAAKRKRRYEEKRKAARREKRGLPTPSEQYGLEALTWDGPMPGVARWRFQTLRDNRLFDERAVRSLAESMHKASQANRHFGEHGFAFSEFGQGVGR